MTELYCDRQKLACKEVVFDGREEHTEQQEVVVPDFLPDAAEVTEVRCSVTVAEIVAGDDSLLLTCVASYAILYQPEKCGGPRAVQNRLTFSHTLRALGVKAGDLLWAEALPLRCEGQTVNSRKLLMKLTVQIRAQACREGVLQIPCALSPQTAQVEQLTEEIAVERLCDVGIKEFDMEEQIDLPAGKPALRELLWADATAAVREKKIVRGKVIIKAVAHIRLLYLPMGDDATAQAAECELPFPELVDVPRLTEQMDTEVRLRFSSCEITANEATEGCRCLTAHLSVITRAEAYAHTLAPVLRDAYGVGMKLECAQQTMRLCTARGSHRQEQTLREVLTPDRSEIAAVLSLRGTVAMQSPAQAENAVECRGTIGITALCMTEEHKVFAVKKAIPVTQAWQVENGDCQCTVNALVTSVSYNLNMSGQLELRIVCGFTLSLEKYEEIACVDSVAVQPAAERMATGVIVYYPARGETLWQIGRRYGVSRKALLEANGVGGEEELLANGMLLVPACG